ncbi:helix-turn-helix transcriptional regulator [Candidatus Uhrbacteria bacterium]|nr:helix-turn-helix transcriptional regulator [Candidatus Uhrbacteria bacterium]
MTQLDFAAKAQVTYYALTKLESGQTRDPRVMTVLKIARALDVKIEDLVFLSH